jgi:hypothetical protein
MSPPPGIYARGKSHGHMNTKKAIESMGVTSITRDRQHQVNENLKNKNKMKMKWKKKKKRVLNKLYAVLGTAPAGDNPRRYSIQAQWGGNTR